MLPDFTGHARNIVSAGDQDALTKPLNASPADDGASQGEPSEMSIKRALETNLQLAEAGKPGMRAFDNPAMLAESSDATASDPGLMLRLRRCCRQCAKPYPFFA